MRSPDEYEAAFYADTTNLDTPVKVGNQTTNRASDEPGDPHFFSGGIVGGRPIASPPDDTPIMPSQPACQKV
jgi:hypothetical protein